jgi:hypothetical protein
MVIGNTFVQPSGIFYGYLAMLWKYGILFRFGILCLEKSGNPVSYYHPSHFGKIGLVWAVF